MMSPPASVSMEGVLKFAPGLICPTPDICDLSYLGHTRQQ